MKQNKAKKNNQKLKFILELKSVAKKKLYMKVYFEKI